MLTGIQVRAADATPLKRWVFERFRRAAEEAEILRADGKPIPAGLRVQCALGELLVYGPVRDQLGLRRARWAYTGGAPLGPDTYRFFRSFGVNLKQVYGSTEVTGLVSLQPDAEANPTTAGRPCPGIDVRIGERGEVLVRSAGIFKGYYKSEEATRETLDAEGWIHSGDVGEIDADGFLRVTDRKKELLITSGGKNIAPQYLEGKLKQIAAVSQAVAIGDRQPYVVALLTIDPLRVAAKAEKAFNAARTPKEAARCPAFKAHVEKQVAEINQGLARYETIKKIALLPNELSVETGELTPTLKLKRRVILERHRETIEGLYA